VEGEEDQNGVGVMMVRMRGQGKRRGSATFLPRLTTTICLEGAFNNCSVFLSLLLAVATN
jgi:hypothetical protein